MRVSEYYNLKRNQGSLDFLDVDIYNDVKLYIDPYSFELMSSEFSNKCRFYIENYFTTLLEYIRNKKFNEAHTMLLQLKEPNETHLGMSIGESRGRALGEYLAYKILNTLKESEAVKSGLLQNIEESALFIEGISYDIISDIVTNIIRAELITYTQHMAELYGIPLVEGISSGPMWNTSSKKWYTELVKLPKTDKGPLLLVPKVIIRKKTNYDVDEYYRHYVMDFLRTKEVNSNSSLVKIFKNGNKTVLNKSLEAKYGSAKKTTSITQTLKYPQIIENYRDAKSDKISAPLEHEELSIIEKSPNINYQKIYEELKKIPTGTQFADKYEKKIEELISGIFSPDLMYPKAQQKLHDGRKRVDITYTNIATEGFFAWLLNSYPAQHIFVECKNYSVDLKNPEFDQLSGRFSPSRGKVGFLVCRKNDNKELALKRCIDTAKDDRGFIIVLEDSDFEKIVKLRFSIDYRKELFLFFKEKFDTLIM